MLLLHHQNQNYRHENEKKILLKYLQYSGRLITWSGWKVSRSQWQRGLKRVLLQCRFILPEGFESTLSLPYKDSSPIG
jgi:hypothetical protein